VVFDRTDIVGLVQALLCRARQREGFTTKTKLVKYLYLADVEHYRRTGKQLTGFRWIFHHYGPWSVEFDDLYLSLRATDDIRVRSGSRPDLDTEFVESSVGRV
jgi:hypothetical protein